MLHRLRCAIGAGCAYDVLMSRELDGARLYARCAALRDGVAFMIVYEDDISPTTRLRACVPMALDSRVTRCVVVNLRTSVQYTMRLGDRDAYFCALLEAS